MTTRQGEPYIKIAGKPYILSVGPEGRPAYSSGTRARENVPSDDFEIVQDAWSGGVGVDFYTGNNFLTAVKGKLYPRPTVTTISSPLTSADRIHFWFESGDYLFAVGNVTLYKFNISASPPVLSRVYSIAAATFSFNANDRLGQPGMMYSARATAGYRWYIPLNNGNRILAIDTVSAEGSQAFSPVVTLNGAINASVTSLVYTSTGDPIVVADVIIIESERMFVSAVNTGTNTLTIVRAFAGTTAATHANATAITQATPDTFTFVTAVTTGASHFQQMPDGKIWRSLRSLASAVAQNISRVSALAAGADCEVYANWGTNSDTTAFAVGDQTMPIFSLMNYGDLLVIEKANGWFVARENADGTLRWEDLLPDANISTMALYGEQIWRRGTVWQGNMMLPSNSHLWRHTLFSALPVDPDAVPTVYGDEAAASTEELRFGRVASVVGMGAWLYGLYNRQLTGTNVSLTEIIVTQSSPPGLIWNLVWRHSAGGNYSYAGSLYPQKRGTGAPRLWAHAAVGIATDSFDYINLDAVGSPFNPSDTLGNASITARLYLMPRLFESNVLLREFRYTIEDGVSTVTWGLEVARNGGSAETVGSTVTATGSLYWTAGTNDEAQRIQAILVATFAAGYGATATPPRVLRTVLFGSYLPRVSDALLFVIDIQKTAARQNKHPDRVRDTLRGYRSTRQTWVDVRGASGQIRIDGTDDQPPYQVGAAETMTIRAALMAYS